MSIEILVSAMAATLTTAAFVPQAMHIIRYKETRAISLLMYVSFAIGVALWLVFGCPDRQLADHASPTPSRSMLALAIIAMKLEIRVRLTRSA